MNILGLEKVKQGYVIEAWAADGYFLGYLTEKGLCWWPWPPEERDKACVHFLKEEEIIRRVWPEIEEGCQIKLYPAIKEGNRAIIKGDPIELKIGG